MDIGLQLGDVSGREGKPIRAVEDSVHPVQHQFHLLGQCSVRCGLLWPGGQQHPSQHPAGHGVLGIGNKPLGFQQCVRGGAGQLVQPRGVEGAFLRTHGGGSRGAQHLAALAESAVAYLVEFLLVKQGGKTGGAPPDGPQKPQHLGLVVCAIGGGHRSEKRTDFVLILPVEAGEYLLFRAGEQALVCLVIRQIGPGQRLVCWCQAPELEKSPQGVRLSRFFGLYVHRCVPPSVC